MKKLLGLLLFLTSSLSFGQNNSLLYQIKGEETKTSYLFGTIHLIPDSMFYFPPKLQKLVAKSEALVLEISNVTDRVKAQELLKLKEGSSFDIFTPEQKDSVLNWGASVMNIKSDAFEAGFKNSKPFVLMQLSMQQLLSGGVKTMEVELEAVARKNKIPVSGLETMEYQISIFDRMPSDELAEMIMEQIRDPKKSLDTYLAMAKMYQQQNLDELSKLMESSGELGSAKNELLDGRNQNWIPKMDELMHSKSTFFAVGAGHLGGENGLIQLLKNKGYEVTPVKY